MAATLKMYYWKADDAAASGVEISSASCLSFGSGARSAYAANITINTYNTTMHHAYTTAEGATDVCPAPHMWGFTYIRATACGLAGVAQPYIKMVNGSPSTARGLGFNFIYDTAVRVNPIQIWNGAGPTSNLSPQNCIFQICDLTSSVPTWKAASVTGGDTGKLALKVHGTASTTHWWSVGMSLMPTVVGHSGQNKVRVELTYY
jgi:hypothetical protein